MVIKTQSVYILTVCLAWSPVATLSSALVKKDREASPRECNGARLTSTTVLHRNYVNSLQEGKKKSGKQLIRLFRS